MNKESINVLKGMFKQASAKQQPEGTWSFALNALFGSWEGDSASITNELGNSTCVIMDDDEGLIYTLIGVSLLPNNRFLLFFTTDSVDVIGIHNPMDCSFEILVKTECLGFKRHRQLNTRNRIISNCGTIVYFTDGITTYKSINIDSLEQYLAVDMNGNPAVDLADANTVLNYPNAWDCVKFNHFMSYTPGCIEVDIIRNGGGEIKAGAHEFAIRYLDENLNATNWSPLHYPIFIYNENVNSNVADGEATGTITDKSIKFNIVDLDITFQFVQLSIASSVNGLGTVDEVYILDKIPVMVNAGVGSAEYTFYGINPASHTLSTLADITVPSIPFVGVVAHEIIDNRLLLANVGNFDQDWATLQRATLMGKTKWRMYHDYVLDPVANDSNGRVLSDTNSEIIFEGKTFMRDEIYALGVVYLFDDGSESPVLHLPGRPIDVDFDGNDLTTTATGVMSAENEHNTRGNNPTANEWDSHVLQILYDAEMTLGAEDDYVAYSNVQHMLDTIGGCNLTPETAASFTTTFTLSAGPSPALFTLTFADPNDRAIVRITTQGVRTNYGAESVFKFLTSGDNTLSVPFGSSATEILTIEIFYYDDSTGLGYHELTGGGPLTDFNTGLAIPIYFNKCVYKTPTTDCNEVERWKVHNTFVVESDTGKNEFEGYMGFYENRASIYPSVKDCNGVGIFDASGLLRADLVTPGVDMTGDFIRHHRMPDCGGHAGSFGHYHNMMGLTHREWVDEIDDIEGGVGDLSRKVRLNKVGLIVDMEDVYLNIPTELKNKIKGHYIVYGERTNQNKTIIDKGYMWRNQNKATFWQDALESGYGNYYGLWSFYRSVGLPYSYDDCVLGLTDTGRIKPENYANANGYRADFAFTSSIPTYMNYGYDAELVATLGIAAPKSSVHGKEYNLTEYVSPSTVFNKTTPTGDYIKIECPIVSYHPSGPIIDYNSSERELEVVQVEDLNLGTGCPSGVHTRENWFDTSMHASFNNVASHVIQYTASAATGNPMDPKQLSYLGFHRKMLGAAIIGNNSEGSASQFTVPTTLNTGSYGQVSSFYQVAQPFPLPLSPGLTHFGDIMAGMDDPLGTSNNWTQQDAQDQIAGFGMSNFYVAIKNHKDVFGSLEDITYFKVNPCYIHRLQSDGVTPTDFTQELIKGGDTFITKMRAVKTWSKMSGEGDKFTRVKAVACSLEGFVESDKVNCSLAHSSVPESNYPLKYMSRFVYLSIGRAGDSFNKDTLWDGSGVDFTSDTSMSDAGYGFREFKFQMNKDFSKGLTENVNFPLSDTYDYCNNCGGREPNSIYYSIKGFAENQTDNFKTILANQRFSIPSESGPITNLFLEKDQLYAHTPKALFSVQTRPQQLNSDAATVFVGTGEIGSIPPQRLISVQYGYGGSIDPFATIGTQYGTFFVDSEAGRVFLFGKGLNEISQAGMEQWFFDYLPLEFDKQFYNLTGQTYPVKGTSADNSVGFQAVFDPRMNRIILHKKDYLFRDAKDNGDPITINSVIYDSILDLPLLTSGVDPADNEIHIVMDEYNYVTFYNWDGNVYNTINLNNGEWVANKGWTLSYTLDENFWVSFHSYQPNFMYNDGKHFYSFINNILATETITWKHNGEFQTYYGTKYDHILDMIIDGSPNTEQVYYNCQFVGESGLYNTPREYYNKIEDVTFDRMYSYNSKQCSSLRALVVKESNLYQDVTLPMTQTLIDRTDNFWRFSRFRDEVVDRTLPFFTSRWENLQSYYDLNGQGFIDRVLDPLIVDNTKSIYQQSRFRDKYFGTRLFFNPEGNYKIRTEILSFLSNLSSR